MIVIYSLVDGQLEVTRNFQGEAIPQDCVWIDLVDPSTEEELFVEKQLNVNAPTRQEMKKIEVMSKSYQEGDATYMTASILKFFEKQHAETDAITFILTKGHLVTLRYSNPKSFALFADFAKAHPYVCISSDTVFEGLLESVINRLADILEHLGEEVNKISANIFGYKESPEEAKMDFSSGELNKFLQEIGRAGDLASKIRESLLSVDRVLIFHNHICEGRVAKENVVKIKTMRTDIHALSEQASFLSSEVTFLLDATLGMINIQQNNIIKIFSIAAVMLMPPTLVASIYGMNFHKMPELDFAYGYPLAILLMLISAFIPYRLFKKKGWL